MQASFTFTRTVALHNQVPAFPRSASVLAEVFARIRADYPSVTGLTHVTGDTAVFQTAGDATLYCLRISQSEAAALGYVAF